MATTIDFAWALAAGSVGDRLRGSPRVRRRLDRASGATFIGLGTAAALSRH